MEDRLVVGSRVPSSSAIRNLCRPRAAVMSSNGRSGVTPPIESGDVIPDVLKPTSFRPRLFSSSQTK